jgi:seryl-tRNA synthetase
VTAIPSTRTDRELAALLGGLPAALPHPKVTKLAEKARELHAQLRTAKRDVAALEDERGQAVAADRNAYAAAIRAGKADPGTPHADAADHELAAARRRLDALHLATDQLMDELIQCFRDEHDQLSARTADLAAAAAATFTDALAQLRRAGDNLAHANAAVACVDRWPGRSRAFAATQPFVLDVRHPNGEPYRLGEVIDALSGVTRPEGRE